MKEQIKRLKQIETYYGKMNATNKQDKKEYFLEGIKLFLHEGETVENYSIIAKEYEEALQKRKQIIEDLFQEVRNIKKLKV